MVEMIRKVEIDNRVEEEGGTARLLTIDMASYGI